MPTTKRSKPCSTAKVPKSDLVNNLILDTHILLWWLAGSRQLSARARTTIAAADTVHVSAASAWEIAIKRSRGKLHFEGDLDEQISLNGFRSLPITARHAWEAGHLPWHHADPFDRMLIAQALAESMTLVTGDKSLGAYGVPMFLA